MLALIGVGIVELICGAQRPRCQRRSPAPTYTGPTTLQPDQTSELTFELSMHPGMDGAHDMTIHVPVQYADGTTSVLDLAVTGDFRD